MNREYEQGHPSTHSESAWLACPNSGGGYSAHASMGVPKSGMTITQEPSCWDEKIAWMSIWTKYKWCRTLSIRPHGAAKAGPGQEGFTARTGRRKPAQGRNGESVSSSERRKVWLCPAIVVTDSSRKMLMTGN